MLSHADLLDARLGEFPGAPPPRGGCTGGGERGGSRGRKLTICSLFYLNAI